MKRVFLIALMLCCFCLHAKPPRLSRYELCWSLLHPVAALKVKGITKRCYVIYNDPALKVQLDSFASGGRLDAFRHAFFMAAYAQRIKTKKLRKLGKAHEKGNYRQFLRSRQEEGEVPDSLSSVMDLQNNELGLRVGSEHQQTALADLKVIVISEIRNGNAVILKRNSAGHYVSCSGSELDLSQYRKVWAVPKCMIPSN